MPGRRRRPQPEEWAVWMVWIGPGGTKCDKHGVTRVADARFELMNDARASRLRPCPCPLLLSVLAGFPPSPSLSLLLFSFLPSIFFLFSVFSGHRAQYTLSPLPNAIYTPACRTSHEHGCRDSSPRICPSPTPQGASNPSSHRHARPQPWHSVVRN